MHTGTHAARIEDPTQPARIAPMPMPDQPSSRFFVALRPDPVSAARLGQFAAELARRCRGRPLAARDLHMTLAFVGERPVDDAAQLTALLAGLPELQSHALALDAIGRFGPALLWIGPSAAPDWMRELSDAVRLRLDAGGIAFDRRPLHPHLTLVRNARDRAAADASTGPARPVVIVPRWRLIVGGSHPAPTPLRRYLWRRLPRPADA